MSNTLTQTSMSLSDVSVHAGTQQLLHRITLRANSGELVVVLGANGAGKTTLAKALLGLVAVDSGTATINELDSQTLSAHQRALQVAYLPQVRPLAWPVCVTDIVALGRFAYGVTPGRLQPADQQKVDRAIVSCQLDHLKRRRTDSLSGGELARVHCARAFASEAPLLVADEPIAALDPKHQYLIMQLIRDYVSEGGGAMVILHDPTIAARFADRLVWMQAGKIVADGTVRDTLTSDQLLQVYGIDAAVSWADSIPHVTILGPTSEAPHS